MVAGGACVRAWAPSLGHILNLSCLPLSPLLSSFGYRQHHHSNHRDDYHYCHYRYGQQPGRASFQAVLIRLLSASIVMAWLWFMRKRPTPATTDINDTYESARVRVVSGITFVRKIRKLTDILFLFCKIIHNHSSTWAQSNLEWYPSE